MTFKISTLIFFLFWTISLTAQEAKPVKNGKHKSHKTESTTPAAPPAKEKKTLSIADTLKTFKAYPGLFSLYQDTSNGAVLMRISSQQIGKEYIYFSHTSDGVLPAGHFRGSFRYNRIVSLQRYYNRVEWVMENTGYYFDPQNAISKAAGANINRPVLASLKIIKEDPASGDLLVLADGLFLSENLDPIKNTLPPGLPPGSMFDPGKMSKEKSKYKSLRNYPNNTDVVVEYVYENAAPQQSGGKEVTDARNVTLQLQHSLIEMPDSGYMPRRDDPRVGYFMDQVEDMTTTQTPNYKDVIHRWRLQKKEPNARMSEPVQPIVWWIENTTPLEFRETIRQAGLQWNIAFEAAGFKNAIEIKEQPDTASWDAGDIRYNVLRWTSSPTPPFGGYGPSFVNPRTGEILGADIMLEYVFITNRLAQEKLFEVAGLPHDEHLPSVEDPYACSLGLHLQQSCRFGEVALAAEPLSEAMKGEYLTASIYYLVLHEMGHTLGLMHNMRSSQLWNPDQLQDTTLTRPVGLIGSVMDYPTPNVSPKKDKQGQFFTHRPGPYDIWAIQYGYMDIPENPVQAEQVLQAHLQKSSDPKLAFGNDADDMRNAGKANDPRVMVNDLSSDAIRYAQERMDLVNTLLPNIKKRYLQDGDSYHALRNAYVLLTGEYANSARVISRYIGGVYIERAYPGQSVTTTPYSPVSEADQKRAMQIIGKYVLAPQAMPDLRDLYAYLQPQRRGYNAPYSGEDPKLHDRMLAIQQEIFNHLLHPATLKRITDASLYGNVYTVNRMLDDLTQHIFMADMGGSVNTFRQQLQDEYVRELIEAYQSRATDRIAKAQVWNQLDQIQAKMKANVSGDAMTRAHRKHLAYQIEHSFEKE